MLTHFVKGELELLEYQCKIATIRIAFVVRLKLHSQQTTHKPYADQERLSRPEGKGGKRIMKRNSVVHVVVNDLLVEEGSKNSRHDDANVKNFMITKDSWHQTWLLGHVRHESDGVCSPSS